jgi:NADH-quinone oxidoreductase subunit N
MGYVLLALAAHNAYGLGMMLFFLTAYVFTNMGLLLIVHTSAEESGGHGIECVAGLAQRSPGLAAALLCFLLSLAGIPFVVGFWAKLYVLLAAWRAGMMGLVIAAIVLAVMGLFYYLRVLQSAYMAEPGDLKPPKPGAALGLAVIVCTVAVVGLGLWPGPLVDGSMAAAHDLLDHASNAPIRAALLH